MPNTIKLQKYLSQQGISSRRKAEEMIEQGKIEVNDQKAHIGQRVNPTSDRIAVDGETINSELPEHVYFLVYKPVGVVSSTSDPDGKKTVVELVPTTQRIYPVGRLDIDSEGLMILSNDGQFTHQLTHPSQEMIRTYRVQTDRPLSKAAFAHLKNGVKLKDGYVVPTDLHRDGNGWIKLSVYEGKNRMVRRMMERLGYKVKRLIRLTHGPFNIEMLQDKEYIQLSPDQIRKLMV